MAYPPRQRSTKYRGVRASATAIAATLGVVRVCDLWLEPLSIESLLSAGCGVLMLLLTLGLMGQGRLSLSLSALLGVALLSGTLSATSPISMTLTGGLELALILLVIAAMLLKHPGRQE